MLVNKAEQTSCLSLKIQPKHPVVLVFSPSKSKWQNTAPGNHKLAATEMSLEWRMTTLTAHACITKWGVCVCVCVCGCGCVWVRVRVCVWVCVAQSVRLPQTPLLSRLPQNPEQSSVCCTRTGFLVAARGVWFPGQGSNLGALHFEHRVSCGTTRGVPRSYALL